MGKKVFKTHNQQLKLLRSKGLYVPTNGSPKRILEKENYYNIINGYRDLFLDNKSSTEKYKNGAAFSEIKALYDFDFELRSIILKRILKVENEFKSRLAYTFSKRYGHSNYMKIDNFNLKESKHSSIKNVMNLISSVQGAISKQISKNQVIKHYMIEYGYIPLWILVNILPLGTISKFYFSMKQRDKQEIAKIYKLSDKELENILKNLTYCRNKCAHGERVYNFKSSSAIRQNFIHKKLKIDNKSNKGFRDLFSIIISLKLLLNKRSFNKLIDEISKEVKILEKGLTTISIKNVYDKMGFTNNWREIKG